MIQANELRIGNWVYSLILEENAQITSINSSIKDLLNPIELTEEILLKCGFKHKGGGFYIHCKSLIELCNVSDKFFVVGFKDVSLGNIYYLHQLQNLYFALTGQELEINF